MKVLNIYMNELPLFLEAVRQEFDAHHVHYVLNNHELHYHNCIYRFFDDASLIEQKADVILLMQQSEKGIPLCASLTPEKMAPIIPRVNVEKKHSHDQQPKAKEKVLKF